MCVWRGWGGVYWYRVDLTNAKVELPVLSALCEVVACLIFMASLNISMSTLLINV